MRLRLQDRPSLTSTPWKPILSIIAAAPTSNLTVTVTPVELVEEVTTVPVYICKQVSAPHTRALQPPLLGQAVKSPTPLVSLVNLNNSATANDILPLKRIRRGDDLRRHWQARLSRPGRIWRRRKPRRALRKKKTSSTTAATHPSQPSSWYSAQAAFPGLSADPSQSNFGSVFGGGGFGFSSGGGAHKGRLGSLQTPGGSATPAAATSFGGSLPFVQYSSVTPSAPTGKATKSSAASVQPTKAVDGKLVVEPFETGHVTSELVQDRRVVASPLPPPFPEQKRQSLFDKENDGKHEKMNSEDRVLVEDSELPLHWQDKSKLLERLSKGIFSQRRMGDKRKAEFERPYDLKYLGQENSDSFIGSEQKGSQDRHREAPHILNGDKAFEKGDGEGTNGEGDGKAESKSVDSGQASIENEITRAYRKIVKKRDAGYAQNERFAHGEGEGTLEAEEKEAKAIRSERERERSERLAERENGWKFAWDPLDHSVGLRRMITQQIVPLANTSGSKNALYDFQRTLNMALLGILADKDCLTIKGAPFRPQRCKRTHQDQLCACWKDMLQKPGDSLHPYLMDAYPIVEEGVPPKVHASVEAFRNDCLDFHQLCQFVACAFHMQIYYPTYHSGLGNCACKEARLQEQSSMPSESGREGRPRQWTWDEAVSQAKHDLRSPHFGWVKVSPHCDEKHVDKEEHHPFRVGRFTLPKRLLKEWMKSPETFVPRPENLELKLVESWMTDHRRFGGMAYNAREVFNFSNQPSSTSP